MDQNRVFDNNQNSAQMNARTFKDRLSRQYLSYCSHIFPLIHSLAFTYLSAILILTYQALCMHGLFYGQANSLLPA
jgi:hypothetical protein